MTKVFKAPVAWADHSIKIALIGCGGTGSSMVDELFRMHALLVRLGHPGLDVTAWDGDTVSEANVGRQRFWPCDVGWNKAALLISRLNSFGDTSWKSMDRHLDSEACQSLRVDLIITCVDSAKVRVMVGDIGRASRSDETLWLDTGNDSDSGQVILGHWTKGGSVDDGQTLRLPNVLDLYPSLRQQYDDTAASCSTEQSITRQDFGINQRVAGEASGLLWRLVRYGEIDRHGSFVYQKTGEVVPLSISEKLWQSFAA